jgi:hypothetical protein
LSLPLDEMFEQRLRKAETDVVREFASVDQGLVHREFERITADLLRNATVTDFVPVLASRRVRDHLRSMPAAAPAGT